jgi:KUP system potassium uptake protein
VIPIGHNIISVTATFGYLEQPSVRDALRDLKTAHAIEISADRWIVEVGEEDVIAGSDLPLEQHLRLSLFRTLLRVSTPAHKYLGLVYDAAVSKEIIPVVFSKDAARVALPELEVDTPPLNPPSAP